MQARSANLDTYGETPLVSFAKIISGLPISEKDTFVDLGCGRGELCFWVASFYPCKVVGVDIVPNYIYTCRHIVRQTEIKQLDFVCADFMQPDILKGTIFYFYAICLPDHLIAKMARRFLQLQTKVTIITPSFQLNDYLPKNKLQAQFKLISEVEVSMPWGRCMVYIQTNI